MYQEN